MSKTKSAIEIFKNTASFETFAPGATIIAEGSAGKVMYVIKSGQVELCCAGKVIDTLGEGDILGEMSLLEDDSPRSATAKAITECHMVPIDERRFQFLIQQTPFFAIEVMRIMAHRLRHMNAMATAK
ncbi:MAG: cyclic nucleotide-binding domain-containing protein [Planctomycetota bacterium]|nr:cyclic nucleotide-binding domain-containing protein [Planctomycetota bacterium]